MGPMGPIRETTPKSHGRGRSTGPHGAQHGAGAPRGCGLVWGLVPLCPPREVASSLHLYIYMDVPPPLKGMPIFSLSLSLPHVWFRNIGATYGVRDFSTKYHRRDIGASVELFIFRCCRWTGAGGSSLHRMCVELRRCCTTALVADTTTRPRGRRRHTSTSCVDTDRLIVDAYGLQGYDHRSLCYFMST